MNHKRMWFGMTYDSFNRHIYILGGQDDQNFLNHCEQYSLKYDNWIVLKNMPKRKRKSSACIQGSQFIYNFGGFDSNRNFLNDVDRYDIKTGKWKTIKIVSDV